VTAWLLLLPGALVVMCCALYTLLRHGPRAQSREQVHAIAVTGCRLGVLSSVMLALAGLGCLDGQAAALGWAMIVLGLLGAALGCLVSMRYLAEPNPPRSMRPPGNPSLR
jgi:hypothetical protein